MRRSFSFLTLAAVLLAVALGGAAPRAASIPVGGPNPNWTEMQKFEWYLGRLAQAAQMCGAYAEAGVLNRLARMSPYGAIGLGGMRGDGFYRAACVEISAEAKELAADAKRIEAHLEAAYSCRGEGCYGQSLSDWQSHSCADVLKSHLSSRAVESEQVREVTITNNRHSGATLDFQVRVRLKNCEGSFYVDLKESCAITRDYTRGDCQVDGVERY